jgi:hypothetical protein
MIMTKTQDLPCDANTSAECIFHRADVFANDAVDMYVYASPSAVLPETETHIRTVAARVFEDVNDDLLEERIDLDDSSRFMRQVADRADNASWALDSRAGANFASGRLAHAAYYQFQRTIKSEQLESETNVLTSKDVKPFDRSAAEMLKQEGGWVTPFSDGFYGGWEDEMGTHHLRDCGLSYMSIPEEDSWEFFAGTFADEHDRQHGLSAEAECNCGALKGEVRVMGKFSKLTRRLVNNYS